MAVNSYTVFTRNRLLSFWELIPQLSEGVPFMSSFVFIYDLCLDSLNSVLGSMLLKIFP